MPFRYSVRTGGNQLLKLLGMCMPVHPNCTLQSAFSAIDKLI